MSEDGEADEFGAHLKASDPPSVVPRQRHGPLEMTLLEFLTRGFAEDERLARGTLRDLHGRDCAKWTAHADLVQVTDSLDEVCREGERGRDGRIAEHIANNDPDRVLADIAARRRIVTTLCEPSVTAHVSWPILCALALPYADRPGWDEEWRV